MVNPWVQIACAVTWCLFSAGICFGFAAIKPVLVAEGVYGDLCPAGQSPCLEQDLHLNLMWTVAAGSTNAVSLLVGAVLDHKGPRVCALIGVGLLTAGATLLSEQPTFGGRFDPYMAGYTVLALGGPFVFISTFQLANAAPDHSGKVLAAITGAFDTSSALFLFYRLAYQRTTKGISLATFFRVYLLVPLFILVCQLSVMPKESYTTDGVKVSATLDEEVDDATEHDHLLEQHEDNLSSFGRIGGNQGGVAAGTSAFSIVSGAPEGGRLSASHNHHGAALGRRNSTSSYLANVHDDVTDRLIKKTGGIFGILDGYTASEQIRTPWFLLILLMTCLCMLRINFFISTVRAQILYLIGPNASETVGDVFDVALPAGGVLSIPFIGLILDELTTLQILQVMCSASVLSGLLNCLRSFWAQVLGILILVVYRPFYYSVTTELAAKVFGPLTFGRLYGLIMTSSGVFNMLQTVLDRTMHGPLDGNPIPINILLTVSTAIVALALLWFTKHEGAARLKQLELNEEEESPRGSYGAV